LSLWFGAALIAVGVIVNVFAGWQHIRLVRELDLGAASHSHSSAQAVLIAFFLALVGVTMAIYLVSIRSTTHSKLEDGKDHQRPHKIDVSVCVLHSESLGEGYADGAAQDVKHAG
jgi:hypothetical protein